MIDIPTALGVDLCAVVGCAACLLAWGNVSFMHPAVPYFIFHFWCTTQRLVQFALGAPPSALFARQPLQPAEIVRASLLFDLTLCLMTLAWVLAAIRDRRRHGTVPSPGAEAPPDLSEKHLKRVVAVIFPFGVVGLVQAILHQHALATHTAQTSRWDGWDESFATTMIQNWLALALMALIYWYGFRRELVLLLPFYIAGVMLEGENRFLLILPLFFLTYVYLTRHGRRWPDTRVVALLLVGAVVWLPGKSVGHAFQKGGNARTLARTWLTVWKTEATRRDNPDTQFLDMAAAALALADQKGKLYHGATISPILFMWIPRPLWPDKPRHNEYLYDLSTPQRNLGAMTMTTTLMGDSYVNFGIAGVVLVPFLFAFLLGAAYFAAFRKNYYSIGRFTYLVVACSLIQPYRDGLYSFFTFNLFIMLPFGVLALLHYAYPNVNKSDAASPLPNADAARG